MQRDHPLKPPSAPTKHMVTTIATRVCFENGAGSCTERHGVLALVLDAVGRQPDHVGFKINLGPSQPANFLATLTGQNQEPNDRAKFVVANALQMIRNSASSGAHVNANSSLRRAVPVTGLCR